MLSVHSKFPLVLPLILTEGIIKNYSLWYLELRASFLSAINLYLRLFYNSRKKKLATAKTATILKSKFINGISEIGPDSSWEDLLSWSS